MQGILPSLHKASNRGFFGVKPYKSPDWVHGYTYASELWSKLDRVDGSYSLDDDNEEDKTRPCSTSPVVVSVSGEGTGSC